MSDERRWFRCPMSLLDHMPVLSAPELRVMLVYLSFANAQGLAWPAVDTIAGMAGLGRRNAERTIARLRAAGLLQVVVAGGGRSNPTTYHVMDTPACGAGVLDEETPAQSDTKPRRTAPETPAQQVRKPRRPAPDEQIRTEQEQQQQQKPDAAAAAELLSAAGVGEPALSELAKLGAERVRTAIKVVDAKRGVRNRAGAIVQALRDGWAPAEATDADLPDGWFRTPFGITREPTEQELRIALGQDAPAQVQLSDRDRDRSVAMLDADPTPPRALRLAAVG